MTIEFGVDHPATTHRPRPGREGMVIHEYRDVSMYMGMPAGDRYMAAGDDSSERRAALRDMPLATVTFHELSVGEPFFVEASADFLDQFPDLEDDEADNRDPAHGAADPRDRPHHATAIN